MADTAEQLAAAVLAALRARGETVGAAESLTGGLLVAQLVAVPGASAVLRGGVVAYAPQLKVDLLGVSQRVLAEHGTVSMACAVAMARGARVLLGSSWGLATTGVAGPEPSEGKPVGTVHLALAGEESVWERALLLHGTREQIRAQTVTAAVDLLSQALLGCTAPTVGPREVR